MKTKTWKLPKPEKVGGEWEWVPLVRVGRFLPFGYGQDPSDADILLPVPEELELFEQAKKHLGQYSYREVSAWLSETSGRYISHVGLFKRVKIEQKRKAATSIQRFYAEKYKEAAEKAEKLESNRLGKRQPVGESSSPGKASTD